MSKELFSVNGLLLNRPIVVASHPRSGTHLTMDLLRNQFSGCGTEKRMFSFRDTPYINLDNLLSIEREMTNKDACYFNRAEMPLLKTHRLPSFIEPYQYLSPLSEKRRWLSSWIQHDSMKIFVFRDIKSTMISLYYFLQAYDRGGDIHQFIRQVRGKRKISRIGFWAYQASQWLNQNDVLVMNYDSLINNTEKELHRIGAFINEVPEMNMPLLPKRPKSLFARRFGTFFSKHPESTAIMSFESRLYNVDSFTNADDDYIQTQIELVAPGLLNKINQYR